MKTLFKSLLFTLLMCFCSGVSASDYISYQAVVRDADNELLSSTAVGVQLSLFYLNLSGVETVLYTETHAAATDVNGVLTLMIGDGETTDDFSSVDWSLSSVFIRSEIDLTGGTDYSLVLESQFLSVPYAFYALTAEKLQASEGEESATGTITVYPSEDETGATDVTNIQAAIDAAMVVTLYPGTYYINSSINITKSGLTLCGLGHAQNTVLKQTADDVCMIYANGATDVLIEKIGFEGKSGASAYNAAFVSNSEAIRMYKAANMIVQNCEFVGFKSAAINVFNYTGVKREQNHKITANRFYKCWMGVAIWYNSEYSILSDNLFSFCRTAILNESGNWLITGNNICDCRATLIITNQAGDVNYAVGNNPAHGSVVGNTMNHSGDAWSSNPSMTFGGESCDPTGIWIYGTGSLIPHTFSSNVCWYTPLTVSGTLDTLCVTGGLINNATITADDAQLKLIGVDSQRTTTYSETNGGLIIRE